MVVAACRKPVQAQARPNASMVRGVGHTVLPLAVKLLGTVSCWKREKEHGSKCLLSYITAFQLDAEAKQMVLRRK